MRGHPPPPPPPPWCPLRDLEPLWVQGPLGDPPSPGAELQVDPEPPKGAEPGPPRSVIQLLAGSFNSIVSNSSSCCLVVVSVRWNTHGLRRILAEFVAALCPRHGGASTGHAVRGGESSPGVCGQLEDGSINNSSSKLRRAKAHPSRCSWLPGF